ncbi:MAG: hypothetical protein PW789_10130 [Edaphobacter sp.]|uniref:Trm112 family protein n=1 Tax=Edaphobacter sp. TaxID=1934404 RepID=UPI0023A2EA1A|nr:Trm112 family protein [Edaphobacter sp.]MDE1176949.1 hypothetical protein [Edaphobacter sp.]
MVELTEIFRGLQQVVCPVCHKSLRAAENAVVCTGCARSYPIVDGIPVLLESRAE